MNAVRMFVGVVQAGSFSRASERLDIPLATVSRNVADLERQLQVQLLERARTGVTPTLAGQKFYEQSFLAIDALLEAERHLRTDERALNGRLRLATPPSFLPAWDRVTAFQRLHPRVQVHCAVSTRLMDFFADGIDAAFRMGDLHTDNVIARKIGTIASTLVATPDFIRLHGCPRTLDDLRHYPCATWSDGAPPDYQQVFLARPPAIETRFTSNDLHAVLHYVLQDMAIGVLAPYCVAPALRAGALVEVLPDEPRHTHPVHLIYPAHKHQSALLKAFVGFCLQQEPPGPPEEKRGHHFTSGVFQETGS